MAVTCDTNNKTWRLLLSRTWLRVLWYKYEFFERTCCSFVQVGSLNWAAKINAPGVDLSPSASQLFSNNCFSPSQNLSQSSPAHYNKHERGVINWNLLVRPSAKTRPSHSTFFALKMGAAWSSETFLHICQTLRCHVAENRNLHFICRHNQGYETSHWWTFLRTPSPGH